MCGYRLLLPLRQGDPQADLVRLARHLLPPEGGLIELMGIVPVPEGRSLSEGALPAQEIRDQLMALSKTFPDVPLRVKPCVRVDRTPWLALLDELGDDPVDLVLLPMDRSSPTVLGAPLEEVLSRMPCDLVIGRGMVQRYDRVLVPIRGGPHLSLMLRLATSLYQVTGEEITLLAVTPEGTAPPALEKLLRALPFKSRVISASGDPARVIQQLATDYHALVLGATLGTSKRGALGKVPSEMLMSTPLPIFLVRSFRPSATQIPETVPSSVSTPDVSSLSERVDRWFATNTFHWTEFRDLEQLLRWKGEQSQTISLVLPTLNEEATIGQVISSIKKSLMEEYPLLDEIIVMDSDSTDRTREVATELGVPVYIHQRVLADEVGSFSGKGEALWKSLYVANGDIVAWIDTDIVNIHPRFVIGILGPLLRWRRIQYVKGFYQRPLRTSDRVMLGSGGRVTELLARPMINLFFPELSGIIQPLSGEYAGRRSALEGIPFSVGYGVEAGLLVDLLRQHGLGAIAQCNLEVRTHRNQPLSNLSRMSFAILQAFAARAAVLRQAQPFGEQRRTIKTIRYEPAHFSLLEEEITEHERPPMITIPAYRAKFADAKR